MLSLNCIIHGDDPEKIFTVEIQKTKNVSILKDHIKKKKGPHFYHVAASDLELWKVCLRLDNLDTISSRELESNMKLSPPTRELSEFFDEALDDGLHIVVKGPPDTFTALSFEYLSINCLVFGDNPKEMFTVKIHKMDNVSILKKTIKKDNPNSFVSFDPKDLDLWQSSVPLDGLTSSNLRKSASGPALKPHTVLTNLFSSPLDSQNLHIIVRTPQLMSLHASVPPSSFKPIVQTSDVGKLRKEFCYTRKPLAPSTGGVPLTFNGNQMKDSIRICCDRPVKMLDTIPVALLYPGFGQFQDDCEKSTPGAEDFEFLDSIVNVMSSVYTSEDNRKKEILRVFGRHKLPLFGSNIGLYSTDGDLKVDGFRYLLAELENEIGSTRSEPYFQAILYYLESTRKQAIEHSDYMLPCFILLIFGPYVAFAGAAWTDRPNVQTLSTAIPCHYHHLDTETKFKLARHLKALRQALPLFQTYYTELIASGPSSAGLPLHNPTVPYPCSFSSSNSIRNFTYDSRRVGNNLVFFGHFQDGNRQAICIKFTRQYCQRAHELCASMGKAPKLHAVECYPGGWHMVVMDDICKDYVNLYDLTNGEEKWPPEDYADLCKLLSEGIAVFLSDLHQEGLVHGDIRNSNIMVNRSSPYRNFQLVDFDWSGRIGEARYPLDVNTTTVKRPDAVAGGELIKAEHDIEMLKYIWE